MSHFGSRVRDSRIEKKLSQEGLAERIGISRNYLSQIERGLSTNLSLEVAKKLSTELGLLLEPIELSTPVVIPEGLQQLIEDKNLGPGEVRTLAGFEYRGKRPQTIEDWRLLHLAIEAATKERP